MLAPQRHCDVAIIFTVRASPRVEEREQMVLTQETDIKEIERFRSREVIETL